ncbi:aryl-sulfate sulfotransferase [Bacteroidota bacterium]
MNTNIFRNIFIVLLIIITNSAFSQLLSVSPVPGSKFHNPETSIILKFKSPVKSNSLKNDLFVITGSKREYSNINYLTSDDHRTIILSSNDKFEYGETIYVHANYKIELETGLKINIPDFLFHVKDEEFVISNSYYKYNSYFKNKDYFPPVTVNINDNPAEGKIFFHNISAFASDNDRFYAIIENDGSPFFAHQDNNRGLCFTLQKNGYLTFWNNKNFYMLDSTYSVIDSFACGNGYNADWHELQVLENGHAFLMAYDVQTFATNELDDSIKIEGLVIQEIDKNKNVIFQWRSFDHFDIGDYGVDTSLTHTIFIHGNAIEVDFDGHILVSLRAMDQIIKIDRTTGDIIWRLGGVKNEFTFINDVGFCKQHDIRRLPNGNITLYDNGTCHTPQISKAKEYTIDEINKTATLVWEYEHPEKYWASSMGNVQRLDNGNTFINWGQIILNSTDTSIKEVDVISKITEVRPDKSIAYELTFDTYFHLVYRSYRFEWDVPPPVTATNNLIEYGSNINIYPNPAHKYFTINFNERGTYHIDIFNSSGILLKSFNHINDDQIEVKTDDLSTGIYFCRISSGNNSSVTRKIVITK